MTILTESANNDKDSKSQKASTYTESSLHSQLYSCYSGVFYKSQDKKLNPDLLDQALLPPSRFGSVAGTQSSHTVNHESEHMLCIRPSDDLPESLARRPVLTNKKIPSAEENSNNMEQDTNHGKTLVSAAPQVCTSKKRRTPPLKSIRPRQNLSKKGSFRFEHLQIPVAVLLWYLLGVLSISTTKVLLLEYEHLGMTPLLLTIQQLSIGVLFLRGWIHLKNRVPPYPIDYTKLISFSKGGGSGGGNVDSLGFDKLLFSAVFFTLGFWLTNQSFSAADASFVETVKASEPITSASLAVLWGLERMTLKEVWSLLGICAGVVVSTLGNSHGNSSNSTVQNMASSTIAQSFCSSGIVMGANLCFSFRGLYQKLFRASPNGKSNLVDDLNLQYRTHQVGIIVLIGPVLLWELSTLVGIWLGHGNIYNETGGQVWRFAMLSLVNGFAFTHYNLASSYILSRISVVHHAALNCIRRLFAIVMTSIIFRVPITVVSSVGIIISIGGFSCFTHFKVQKKNQHRSQSLLPVSSP